MRIKTLAILSPVLFFVSCGDTLNRAEKKNIKFPVVTVIKKDTVLNSEYITEVHAVKNVEIRARVSGFLDKIFVDEGQEVKKGQPLFSINDEEYKAALAKTKAYLNSAIAEAKGAELEVNKIRLLVEKNVISKTELDVAEAKWVAALSKVDEAKSAVSNASIRLSYAHIKAPFDCIIDRIPLKGGSLINEGSLLTTISDNHQVFTYFHVTENEYLNYVKSKLNASSTKNTKVQLILSDGTMYNHLGKIETVEGEIEPTTGSIAFRARFPNPDKVLKHGASGKVIIRTSVQDALFLPQKCVFEIQDKNYVFVVDSQNKVAMKSFIPRTRLDDFYLIQSGLECGNKILYEGIQNIQDGNQIVPQSISLDSIIRSSL